MLEDILSGVSAFNDQLASNDAPTWLRPEAYSALDTDDLLLWYSVICQRASAISRLLRGTMDSYSLDGIDVCGLKSIGSIREHAEDELSMPELHAPARFADTFDIASELRGIPEYERFSDMTLDEFTAVIETLPPFSTYAIPDTKMIVVNSNAPRNIILAHVSQLVDQTKEGGRQ